LTSGGHTDIYSTHNDGRGNEGTERDGEATMTSKLLTEREVAQILSISTRTLRRWIAEGDAPRPIQMPGRDPRWREKDVEAWINRRPVAR
jgi:prophage regulatory protein